MHHLLRRLFSYVERGQRDVPAVFPAVYQPVKEASQQIKIQHVKSDMPGIHFGFFIEVLKQQPERTFVR